MTPDEVRECFEKHSEKRYEGIGTDMDLYEYYEFEKIENPLSTKEDLCAMMKLAQLVPNDQDLISGAKHDEIWFEPSFEDLSEANITEADIIYLIRCGVRVSEYDCLGMFV